MYAVPSGFEEQSKTKSAGKRSFSFIITKSPTFSCAEVMLINY